DTVLVRVDNCTGIEEAGNNPHDYRLIPNLFNGDRSARIVLGNEEEGVVEIYAMDGRLVSTYKVRGGVNTINLGNGIPTGVFVYKVWIGNEIKTNGKLVIVQ
ncbi:MAG: T9SS type A sorting domain-containing protein, partial [Chitinophagales bacterium]|nr:T9SS type A sorting domain-containing protein [Chitinophagales bacterium]